MITNLLRGFQKPTTRDLSASLVVFLVALPLSLGIALASGAPILAGIIGAAVGGIVVGFIGGAPLQVSGPAAGLTVIVFGIVQQYGWPVATVIFMLAGAMQLAFGFLKVARVSLAISPAVVHGMLAGIGIVIALAQLHVVMGDKPEASALKNIQALPSEIATHHSESVVLGLLTFAILVGWNYVPKKLKALPGPLIAVLVPTIISLLIVDPELKRVDLPANIVPFIGFPNITLGTFGTLMLPAFTVALVASVESLLCAVATDALHPGKRADLDRELVGQGAGNLVSGFLGGLPVTGVIVRSSANIAAGAQTKWSAILHGFWIIAFAAVGASMIEEVPLSVLAGLLVYVGVRLVRIEDIKELAKHRELPIYFATLLGVVFKDLLFGVGLGIVLAIGTLIFRMSRVSFRREDLEGRYALHVDGSMTFISVPKLTTALNALPETGPVEIHLHTDFLDHAAFEALHNWAKQREEKGDDVLIREHHDDWYLSAMDDKPKKDRTSPRDILVRMGDGSLPLNTGHLLKSSMKKILQGVQNFHKTKAPSFVGPLRQLVKDGQRPSAMLVTCSDSRMLPDVISSVDPGDLFIVRNVGNIIPLTGAEAVAESLSTGAAIEFAVEALGVKDIIIMGHGDCGAMKQLGKSEPSGLQHLDNWLLNARPALHRFLVASQKDDHADHDTLSKINVVVQLEHLTSYPSIQARILSGELKVHGWWFDLNEAHVMAYDLADGTFKTIEDVYSELLSDDLIPHTSTPTNV